LLEEADLSHGDRRLLEIIRNQGQRLNGIIDSVLSMSRREKPSRHTFRFRPWLDEFMADLTLQHELAHIRITQEGISDTLLLDCDPVHLGQILNNLVRNAAEHAGTPDNTPRVTISAGRDKSDRPWVDVRDNGKGISEAHTEHLFEP